MLLAKISKRNQLTLAFVALTLIALVVAAFGASNYYQFYPAITNIEVRVTSLQTKILNDSTGAPVALQVQVAFSVKNPTAYTGLSLNHFESTYEVVAFTSPTINTTISGTSLPYSTATGTLNPGDNVKIGINPFNATREAAQRASQPGTRIQLVFHLHFVLSSFLNKVALVVPSYDCMSSRGPTICAQTGMTLLTAPGGLGGGGGGGGA
jgi:hypothetical protein